MCNILYVSSSPRGSASYSNRVAARVIDELRQANPQSTLTVRELAQEPLPHIDADFVAATRNAGGPNTNKQRAILTKSDALVDELLAADIVVIAAPMINFSVSTTLQRADLFRCQTDRVEVAFFVGRLGGSRCATGRWSYGSISKKRLKGAEGEL